MSGQLEGRTALVTGGAKRIGKSVVIALADAGADVIIHYNKSEAEAQELAEKCRMIGVRAWALQADFTALSELDSCIDRACEVAGSLDILVNNASTFPANEFDSVTLDDLSTSIRTDAWAPFALGRRFAEVCRKGHVVNFLDTRIVGYDWKHVAYHSSKYLLGLFTRMMALRFSPGISVNAVAPGLILPPEGKDMSYLESLKNRLPLQRVGSPEEVAKAVVFLASSDFITGQVIFIDGGRHLREANLG